jgi:hypothetical protein
LLYPGLFLLLGLGFMLIEVSLIQRFMLYLGQPVHVLAVVLFALLFGMSLGSMLSKPDRGGQDRSGACRCGAGRRAHAGAAERGPAGGLRCNPRPVAAGPHRHRRSALMPLGIVLGMPFPLAVRALALAGDDDRIPWMWAINGVASVLGAGAAMLGAMLYGLSLVLLAAVTCATPPWR